jgi:hypothetical protein
MASRDVTVRPATAADVGPLAAVMARAFDDDPVFVWMLPRPDTRQARAAGVFATALRTEELRHGAAEVACAGDAIVGGAIWLPPGHWAPAVAEQLRSLPGFARALGRRFQPAGTLALPPGAPVITAMWRPPAARRSAA